MEGGQLTRTSSFRLDLNATQVQAQTMADTEMLTPPLPSTTDVERDTVDPSAAASTSASASASSPAAGPSSASLRRRLTHISPTDHLYLRLPSGIVKYVKPWSTVDPYATMDESSNGAAVAASSSSTARSQLSKQQKRRLRTSTLTSLGKYGSFDLADLECVPYGWTWEIGPPRETDVSAVAVDDDAGDGDDTLPAVPEESNAKPPAPTTNKKKGKHGANNNDAVPPAPGSLRIMVGATLAELEETTATNEEIYDDPNDRSGPRLTMLDVQAMRDAGLEGQDLIEEMTRTSSSFEKRTVYSQDKFIKRKEAKHLRLFTPLAPSLSVMADYHFERWSEKVRGLRTDALAQMLSFSNIAPGGRYIVVDGANGLLTAACIERMGGQGRLLAIHDNEAQPEFEVLHSMNLPSRTITDVLRVLHWAQVDPSFEHAPLEPIPDKLDEETSKQTPQGIKAYKSNERLRHKLLKRHAIQRDIEALRADMFAGDWDGLILATPYEPVSIVRALQPYLAGSSNLVIHSPYLQPLVEAHSELRASPQWCNLSLTEPWLRRYQVLPGRTHPEMQTSATAGFLLHGVRVLSDDEVERLMAAEEAQAAEAAEAASLAAAGGKRGRGDGDGDGDDEGDVNKEVATSAAEKRVKIDDVDDAGQTNGAEDATEA